MIQREDDQSSTFWFEFAGALGLNLVAATASSFPLPSTATMTKHDHQAEQTIQDHHAIRCDKALISDQHTAH